MAKSLTELRRRCRTRGTGGRATRPSLSSSGRRRTGRVIDLSVSMAFLSCIATEPPGLSPRELPRRWTATLPDHVQKCDEIPRESPQKKGPAERRDERTSDLLRRQGIREKRASH